jgi:hypothetical protein
LVGTTSTFLVDFFRLQMSLSTLRSLSATMAPIFTKKFLIRQQLWKLG